MIDVSSWFLFEADSELHEFFPFECADSPRARRLQVLMAEARAGGVERSVIAAVFFGWARIIARFVPAGAEAGLLAQAIQETDDLSGAPIALKPQNALPTLSPSAAPVSPRRKEDEREDWPHG